MAIKSSGPLYLYNDIGRYFGLGASNVSLRNVSSRAGKGTPDAMSEFYGYGGGTPPPPPPVVPPPPPVAPPPVFVPPPPPVFVPPPPPVFVPPPPVAPPVFIPPPPVVPPVAPPPVAPPPVAPPPVAPPPVAPPPVFSGFCQGITGSGPWGTAGIACSRGGGNRLTTNSLGAGSGLPIGPGDIIYSDRSCRSPVANGWYYIDYSTQAVQVAAGGTVVTSDIIC